MNDLTYKVGYFKGQPKDAPGFCTNKKHIGKLSAKNIKKHRCVEKKCVYFRKWEHPYWEGEETRKQHKKLGKRLKRIENVIRFGTNEEIAELIIKLVMRENK